MPTVSPERFERLLGALDATELAAFVAELWAARGFETSVDGTIVTAVHPDRGDREIIRCLPRRRWGGRASPAQGGVDVVVTARGVRSSHADARLLGPRALRGMVLYAIDREAADRLLAAHLGRLDPRWPDWPRGRPSPTTLLVGCLVLVALVGVIAGAGDAGWSVGGAEEVSAATPVPTRTADDVATATRHQPTDAVPVHRYPPGLGPTGLTDPDRLAAAHSEALADYPYAFTVVHHGSPDLLHPDRQWVDAWQTVYRVDERRYWLRVSGVAAPTPDTRTTVSYEEFADRSDRYRWTDGPDGPTYERLAIPETDGAGRFTALAHAYIARYLATTESRVEAIDEPYGTTFRVVATGTPTRIEEPVAAYTAVALVDWQGVVHGLTVSYRIADTDGATPAATADRSTVRFEFGYVDVGNTYVSPPWYDEARNATAEERATARPGTATPAATGSGPERRR